VNAIVGTDGHRTAGAAGRQTTPSANELHDS
jgi:hypothetical protein